MSRDRQQHRLHATAVGALTLLLLAVVLPAVTPAGADQRVNDPGQDTLPNCTMQAGVSMARWGERIVAGWNDGRQCDLLVGRTVIRTVRDAVPLPALRPAPVTGISLSGFAWSDDAGATWHDGGELPPPEDGNVFGDPVLAAGPDGTFYYATLLGTPDCCRIGVYRSHDGGVSWEGPVLLAPERADRFHDKPWIAVDTGEDSPHRGTVYVAWANVVLDELGRPKDDAGEVLVSRSTDGGATFAPAASIGKELTPDGGVSDAPGSAAQVAVGPDGEVYVAWVDLVHDQGWLYIAASTDGGGTFTSRRPVAKMTMPGHLTACAPLGTVTFVANGDIRVAYNPSLAVDRSDSPYRGRLYIAVGVQHVQLPTLEPHDQGDIVLMTSDDAGVSWTNVTVDKDGAPSAPIERLNTDETWADQFHASVAVAEDGTVAVSWYDRRLSPKSGDRADAYANWFIDVFATTSSDGGETFAPETRITDESFPPPRTNPHPNWLSGCFMGDYNAVVSTGPGAFLLAWADARGGTDVLPDVDIYVDRLVADD